MPSLSPYVRSGLKPPLLQQAAFDDIVFKVDVMRNVASRQMHNRSEDIAPVPVRRRWGSLPAIDLFDKKADKDNEEDAQNVEEQLQEVAGKLEIRVVPKEIMTENVPKDDVPVAAKDQVRITPNGATNGAMMQNGSFIHNGMVNTMMQNTTMQNAMMQNATTQNATTQNALNQNASMQNATVQNNTMQNATIQNGSNATQNGATIMQNGATDSNTNSNNKDSQQTPQKVKLERTKSILKQSSKERNDHNEPHSPKREQITFAPDTDLDRHNHEKAKKIEKRISIEGDPSVEKRRSLEIENARELLRSSRKSGSESSKSDSSHSNKNDLEKIAEMKEANCHVNFKDRNVEGKPVHKPLEKVKNNAVNSKSESSSSTQEKSDNVLR